MSALLKRQSYNLVSACNSTPGNCNREKLVIEKKEKNAKALKEAGVKGLPELIGTERQKAYANFLRVDNLKSL